MSEPSYAPTTGALATHLTALRQGAGAAVCRNLFTDLGLHLLGLDDRRFCVSPPSPKEFPVPSHDDTSNKEVQFVNVDDVPCAEAGEGVKVGHIHVTDSATAWIVHFAPGSRLPQVDEHDGEEHYFVLRGDLIDGDRHHRAGDWVVMPAGSSHQPGTDTGAVLLGISLPRQ